MPTDSDQVRLKEARHTFNRIGETVRQQANHIIEIIKINLLLLGSVPLAGVLSRSGINSRYIVVIGLIFASMMFQMYEYSQVRFAHGVNTELIREESDSGRILEEAIKVYSEESTFMSENNQDIAKNLLISILLTVSAVTLLLLVLIS